ncbi:hypothetical protein ACP4OV_029522 [Aristida adscensionis]
MCFPPSFKFWKIFKSRSGSNQPDPLAIEYPFQALGESAPPAAVPKSKEKQKAEVKAGNKKKQVEVPPSSPAAATRSKMVTPDSPAMGTRSTKKLL